MSGGERSFKNSPWKEFQQGLAMNGYCQLYENEFVEVLLCLVFICFGLRFPGNQGKKRCPDKEKII